ncbi:MAG: hypothetical protein IMX01_08870 [Limnochordaceae bacterium]|nr:hypothetical protein [Limnochordaceae bacterium]
MSEVPGPPHRVSEIPGLSHRTRAVVALGLPLVALGLLLSIAIASGVAEAEPAASAPGAVDPAGPTPGVNPAEPPVCAPGAVDPADSAPEIVQGKPSSSTPVVNLGEPSVPAPEIVGSGVSTFTPKVVWAEPAASPFNSLSVHLDTWAQLTAEPGSAPGSGSIDTNGFLHGGSTLTYTNGTPGRWWQVGLGWDRFTLGMGSAEDNLLLSGTTPAYPAAYYTFHFGQPDNRRSSVIPIPLDQGRKAALSTAVTLATPIPQDQRRESPRPYTPSLTYTRLWAGVSEPTAPSRWLGAQYLRLDLTPSLSLGAGEADLFDGHFPGDGFYQVLPFVPFYLTKKLPGLASTHDNSFFYLDGRLVLPATTLYAAWLVNEFPMLPGADNPALYAWQVRLERQGSPFANADDGVDDAAAAAGDGDNKDDVDDQTRWAVQYTQSRHLAYSNGNRQLAYTYYGQPLGYPAGSDMDRLDATVRARIPGQPATAALPASPGQHAAPVQQATPEPAAAPSQRATPVPTRGPWQRVTSALAAAQLEGGIFVQRQGEGKLDDWPADWEIWRQRPFLTGVVETWAGVQATLVAPIQAPVTFAARFRLHVEAGPTWNAGHLQGRQALRVAIDVGSNWSF